MPTNTKLLSVGVVDMNIHVLIPNITGGLFKGETMIKSVIEDEKSIRRRARQAECEIGIMVSGLDPYHDLPRYCAMLGINMEWLAIGEGEMIANPQKPS